MVIDRHASRHGPITQARAFTKANSWLYAAASFGLLLLTISPYESTARWAFHYSKVYEYVDVLGVRAGGGVIDLHFAIHHLTTPYLTLVRVLWYPAGWRVIGVMNTFHHVLMYAYFGGATYLRPALSVTGTAQLIVGGAGEIWFISQQTLDGHDMPWPHYIGLGVLCTYLVLWIRDSRLKAPSQHGALHQTK